jgi:hypothetical protein
MITFVTAKKDDENGAEGERQKGITISSILFFELNHRIGVYVYLVWYRYSHRLQATSHI